MYSEMEMHVVDVYFEDREIQRLKTDRGAGRALLYKRITAPVKRGDKIIVNTTATELNLGTGGWDIVRYACPSREKEVSITKAQGHIMKARYTPIQHSILSVEAEESIHHEQFKQSFSLKGRTVLLAELHSMVPLIYYFIQEMKKDLHCCVIFDDQASLPLMMSKQLSELHKEKQFTSITTGQAFGGQYEAVTVASALQCALSVVKADVIVISVGPGVVGTGTMYGFSGLAIANWSHTVSALEGVPVWIPRLSFAEKRERHYGISHHTLTPLSMFTFKEAVLPIPFIKDDELNRIKQQLQNQPFQAAHEVRFAKEDLVSNQLKKALDKAVLPIQTMGRKYEDDPAFFLAVAEAVRVALE